MNSFNIWKYVINGLKTMRDIEESVDDDVDVAVIGISVV